METKTARITAVAVGLAILAAPCLLDAQILSGLTLEKLGMLDLRGAGARPFAMGGAYTAVSDDAFGLIYNPAGLAEVTRREITVGIHFRRDDVTNRNVPFRAEHVSDNTSLDHLAAIYPYPTYRGSFVVAVGAFRVGSSNLESIKNAYLAQSSSTVQDIFKQSGEIYQYDIGFGLDLSPRIAAGLSLALWDEGIDFTEEIDQDYPDSTLYYTDRVSLDLGGFSFKVGLLFRPSDATRIGLAVTSPVWLNYSGQGVTTLDGDFTAGGGFTTEPAHGTIDDDYTLPMRFDAGASARVSQLLVAADVGYSDYSQTRYNGEVITDELDPANERVLKAKWDVRAGAELTLPWAPIYLRGGFSYVPLPIATVEELAYLVEDRPISRVAPFDMTTERTFFTVGLGGLIDGVLSLDAALSFGGYEKLTKETGSGVTVFSEKRDVTEFIVSGSYRF